MKHGTSSSWGKQQEQDRTKAEEKMANCSKKEILSR